MIRVTHHTCIACIHTIPSYMLYMLLLLHSHYYCLITINLLIPASVLYSPVVVLPNIASVLLLILSCSSVLIGVLLVYHLLVLVYATLEIVLSYSGKILH